MNFLAHIYLSGKDLDIRFGNFIGDDVKGNGYLDFPERIQKGILLHRHIDSFTDTHESTSKTLQLLYPKMGKVSGIALDIYNDHFLAKNWEQYSDEKLLDFTLDFYKEVQAYSKYMPPSLERLYYFMQKDNWLYHYKSKSKLSTTFSNMVKKYPFAEKLNFASECLVEHYDSLEEHFSTFFPLLRVSSKDFVD